MKKMKRSASNGSEISMPTKVMFPGHMPSQMPTQMPIPCPYQSGGPNMMPPTSPIPDIGLERPTGPPVMVNANYLQGYLKTILGRFVRVDFLIGTGTFVDKEGTLVDVGIDYITLREAQTDNLVICDLYSIKFVSVIQK